MKKTIFAIALASASFSAFAVDGTFAGSNQYPDAQGNSVRYTIFDTDGKALVKANGAVQFKIDGVVVGPGSAGNAAGVYNFFLAGVFSAGSIAVPDKAGQTVSITIEVWDKTTGATYATATEYLPAQTVTVKLGGDGTPPANPAYLTGFTGGTLVPEPSTYALAALGLGGLLFISRRK